jgi:hypothetical protein
MRFVGIKSAVNIGSMIRGYFESSLARFLGGRDFCDDEISKQ